MVAQHAGVSATTVSHALSGRRPVSEATRAKVRAAAEELGYRPNKIASSLRTQKSLTSALIIPDITNPFYPEVARGVQDLLGVHGYQLYVCNTDSSQSLERSFLSDSLDRRVDGIVLAPSSSDVLEGLQGTDVPVVLLTAMGTSAARSSTRGFDVVHSDDERGMELVVTYLVQQGHRHVGFINGDGGPAGRREAGFRRTMLAAGLKVPDDFAVSGPFTRAGGVDGMTQLLSRRRKLTAVVCANDLIAIGALDVAHKRGIAVPSALAIVGFDDIEAASLVSPPLTTVVNPAREIGHACARLLLDRMTEEYLGRPREVVVANTLVCRESA